MNNKLRRMCLALAIVAFAVLLWWTVGRPPADKYRCPPIGCVS